MNSSEGETSFFFLLAVADRMIEIETLLLCVSCFRTTLKLLNLCVCWRTGKMDEKAENYKHEWLQIMKNFDHAAYHLWHLRKRRRKKSVNLTILSSISSIYSTAGWPRHIIWFLSDRFCFPFQSWSGLRAPLLHTLLPSREWRQMLQWIKAIWFASPPFSLAYNSSRTGTHTRNNRHSVNSWKGTASFRWSQLLYPPYNNSAYRG